MLDLGVTGPMIRAGGLKWDARKENPHSSYEHFDFEIPTRTENDVYARYQVRVEEMRQSTRIVKQALEGMPSGAWKADAPHIVLPDREKMKTADGVPDLPFQDRDRRVPRTGGRSVSGGGIAAR